MKNTKAAEKDQRLERIQDMLVKFALFDFSGRIPVSEKGDDIDAVILGLNTLGEELSAREKKDGTKDSILMRKELDEQTLFIEKNEKRINDILNILLQYTLMDFSEKISVSEEGDELDAIIVGINTLSEELVSHIRQVEDTNKQLASVNKELESFTYSVSHDLRSPLRAIGGYANIIREDYGHLLDDEGKRLLGVIQYNTKRMGTLIDDLLAFSRLGRKDIQKSVVNMKELCQGVMIELSKAVKHNAEVRIGDLHAAMADYSLISQVMANLISNAVKYSSKAQNPIVEITSEQKDGAIIYTVKDNGTGFDMKYVHKLFGVFQRLHTQEEFEGTGVGLAIVQRIVHKHGGEVGAESQLGKGATFYFSLPLS